MIDFSRRINLRLMSIFALLFASAFAVYGDEGMWTFDNPPLARIEKTYGVKLSKEWLDHLRLSSVRLNDGGSASFVSANGLILTNHHVAEGCIGRLSSEKNDYSKNGYGTDGVLPEVPCPGTEANILVGYENVTARVLGSVPKDATDIAAADARKAEIAVIEKSCTESTGLRCDVVRLYEGGEYWLYRYEKYKDVRLVFAPETSVAQYGGDPDNFNYPRHDLDFTLLRAYGKDGKPAHTANFLKWDLQAFEWVNFIEFG